MENWCLVRFEDGILEVTSRKKVKCFEGKWSAKYNGGSAYECELIKTGVTKQELLDYKENIQEGINSATFKTSDINNGDNTTIDTNVTCDDGINTSQIVLLHSNLNKILQNFDNSVKFKIIYMENRISAISQKISTLNLKKPITNEAEVQVFPTDLQPLIDAGHSDTNHTTQEISDSELFKTIDYTVARCKAIADEESSDYTWGLDTDSHQYERRSERSVRSHENVPRSELDIDSRETELQNLVCSEEDIGPEHFSESIGNSSYFPSTTFSSEHSSALLIEEGESLVNLQVQKVPGSENADSGPIWSESTGRPEDNKSILTRSSSVSRSGYDISQRIAARTSPALKSVSRNCSTPEQQTEEEKLKALFDVRPEPKSRSRRKKYFCYFCKKMVSAIARHFLETHKNEDEVKMIRCLPPNDDQRRKMLDHLRNKGTYLYNTDTVYNAGNLLVSRRPTIPKSNEHYVCCPHCHAYMAKTSLRKHCATCLPNRERGVRNITIGSNISMGKILPTASERVRNDIFAVMNQDEVSRTAAFDPLVIKYANALCQQYRNEHLNKMIRNRIRDLSIFLLEMQKKEESIKDLASIFYPKYVNAAISFIDMRGDVDQSTGIYRKAAVPSQQGTLITKCCTFYIADCIETNKDIQRKEAKDFLKLFKERASREIYKTCQESLIERRRTKSIYLPKIDDIKKLHLYSWQRLKRAYLSLKEKFSHEAWRELLESAYINTLVFNRKRVGELERVYIRDFRNKVSLKDLNDAFEDDHLMEDIDFAKYKYVRFEIRAKLTSNVPILMREEVYKALELALSYRDMAHVHEENPYIFGLPHHTNVKRIDSCKTMRVYAVLCKAKEPHTLRGTKLRKQVATKAVSLNVDPKDMAKFMGHHENIHREYYRQVLPKKQIINMSTVLRAAQGDVDAQCTIASGDGSSTPGIQQTLETASAYTNDLDNASSEITFGELSTIYEVDTSTLESQTGKTQSNLASNKSSDRSNLEVRQNIERLEVTKLHEDVTRYEAENPERDMWPRNKRSVTPLSLSSTSYQFSDASSTTASLYSTPLKKRLKTDFSIICNRRSWTALEIDAVKKYFSSNIESRTLPRLPECDDVIRSCPELRHRTAAQIKAYLNNIMRKRYGTGVASKNVRVYRVTSPSLR